MVLAQGSMMQLIMGTLASAIFSLLQVLAVPYQHASDDLLSVATSFCLVVVFLCASAFKYNALIQVDDVKAKMSLDQRAVYTLDAGRLTMLTFASVLGALVVVTVILTVQVSAERGRDRQRQRAQEAKRLRFLSNQQTVRVLPIDGDGFHIFLSHTWGTGQDQMRIVKKGLLELIPELKVFLGGCI